MVNIRVINWILLSLGISVFIGCGIPIKQAGSILRYNMSSRDISSLMKDKKLSLQLCSLFVNVQDIRLYAFDSIGLKRNKNFTKFVKVDKDYIVEQLTAAKKTSFEQYRWKFPIAGSFPYMGYFDHKDVIKEVNRLKKKGYDVSLGKVDAFSMLGFLSDPVYSFMKDYTLFELASLIIHEQTHATMYLKNNIQFNEEFATFVGDQGGLAYVKMKFGEESEQYKTAVLQLNDYETFIRLLKTVYDSLSVVYNSHDPDSLKLVKKGIVIEQFKSMVREKYSLLFKTENFKRLPDAPINNAYIMSRMTYTKDLSIFRELFKKNNYSLSSTVAQLKTLRNVKGDLKKYIREKLIGT